MKLEEIAPIALDWFKDPSNAAVITAIDMAESAGDPRAKGDATSTLHSQYDKFSCEGFLSFGLGQIFLGVHTPMIQSMSGLVTPCDLAEWLFDPNNNMRAQHAVFANQGFDAWSVHKVGHHLQYLDAARAAIASLVAAGVGQPADHPPVGTGKEVLELEGILRTSDGVEHHVVVLISEQS